MTCDERLLLSSDGTPLDRIHGVETEYGLVTQPGQAKGVMEAHLGGEESWRQFQHGDRRYVDIGDHPEYSTPESINYLYTVAAVLHGHRAMSDQYHDIGLLTANNSDTTGETWATHYNFLTRRAITAAEFIPALAAHNCSNIVWSGAGAVRAASNSSGYSYTLSQRAPYIVDLAGVHTTVNRPLVNLRDEPLADKERFRRIHAITHDTNLVPNMIALGLASTSNVLRAVELGISFDHLVPTEPVKAMLLLSRDPTLRQKVELPNGRQYTGLELQLALAELSLGATQKADYITDQDSTWGEEWINLCDRLRNPRTHDSAVLETNWGLKLRRIERALAATTDLQSADYAKAQTIATLYSRLSPREGTGMQLVRSQILPNSPSTDVLDNGPGMPPTRAALRAKAIGVLAEVATITSASWGGISYKHSGAPQRLVFDDPYASYDPRHLQQLEALAKSTDPQSVSRAVG